MNLGTWLMTEPEIKDDGMDRLLRSAYYRPADTSPGFEGAVMGKIEARKTGWLRQHALLLIMASYWAFTVSIGAWLLHGLGTDPQGLSVGSINVLMAVVAGTALPLWFLFRKSAGSLGSFFLETLR